MHSVHQRAMFDVGYFPSNTPPQDDSTGEGYKERIREKLLSDCDLHTIVRLPQSTFHPATVSTNLLFFQKGTPTQEIWYYEHRLPERQRSYSKTKSIQFEEFAPMITWWDQREEGEVAWQVMVGDLKSGFDLDVKNPNSTVEEHEHTVEGLLLQLTKRQQKITQLISQLESSLKEK